MGNSPVMWAGWVGVPGGIRGHILLNHTHTYLKDTGLIYCVIPKYSLIHTRTWLSEGWLPVALCPVVRDPGGVNTELEGRGGGGSCQHRI